MPALHSLDASCNALESTAGLHLCPALALAALEENRIQDLAALQHLQPLSNLLVLDLSGNPVTELESYRLEVLYPLLTNGVSLNTLDQLPCLAEEKVAALNKHGAADEELAEIREKYFPTEEAQQERLRRQKSVVALQSSYRGFSGRKMVKQEHSAQSESAIAIQARIRGRKDRQSVVSLYEVPAAMVA
mmetsp:Transcript_8927/g.20856  ORF Transcript_8927/g.20856 Transcript_8927/m.20856 type:complete len:189 (-) Transcript_8927:291-857(-)